MTDATHWTVPAEHLVYAGHFPGTPILPGVLLLDMALHTIAAATGIALDVLTIQSVKFSSPARPGDEIVIEHHITTSGTIRFEIVAGVAEVPGVAGAVSPRKIASGSIVPGRTD